MLKAYKYRIYPNKKQEIILSKTFGCSRFVYNSILSYKKEMYEKENKRLSKIELNNYCNRVLKEENEFLKEVDKFALTNSIYNLDNAYKKFFKEKSGYPKFKSKHNSRQSYTTNYTNNNIEVNFDNNRIKLPKLKQVKTKVHRKINGKIKQATISKKANKYYVSILVDTDIEPLPSNNNKIGIDLGIKDIVITSDGKKYENPKTIQKYENKLIKLQRRFSRKKKGSRNYNKIKNEIAKVHDKIAGIRKDFIHKITYEIVSENQVIISEDLGVKDMMKNHSLAKNIADVSWYEITRQLEYKSAWNNRKYIKIDKYYPSTQTCNNCGYKNTDTKNLSIRKWQCHNCNTLHDRDINAAKNILNEGLRLLTI